MKRHAIELIGHIANLNPFITKNAVPRLVDVLNKEEPPPPADDNSAYALSNIAQGNPDLVVNELPKLVVLFEETEDPIMIAWLSRIFGAIGSKYPKLISNLTPKLISMLKNDSSNKSEHTVILDQESYNFIFSLIIRCIGEIALGNPRLVKKAVPTLIEYLNSSSTIIRSSAVEALGNIGLRNPSMVISALPKLVSLLNDSDIEVKANAITAIGYIGCNYSKKVSPFLTHLVSSLEDPNAVIRGAAALSIGYIGRNNSSLSSQILSKLVEMLTDSDEYVRACAADAIGNIGRKNPNLFSEALGKLSILLNDANPDVQAWVADAIGSLADIMRKDRAYVEIISKLIKMLESPFLLTRMCAAEALGCIGDPSALKPLKKLLNEETEEAATFKRDKWVKAKDIIKEAIQGIKNRSDFRKNVPVGGTIE